MKKKTVFFLAIIILMVISYTGCVAIAYQATKGKISNDLMIDPDPNNPFQGTWMDLSKNYLHVIEGMNGAWYVKSITSYSKNAIYTIEKSGDGYVTSNNWRIRVDGNILTVENMTYQRVVK